MRKKRKKRVLHFTPTNAHFDVMVDAVFRHLLLGTPIDMDRVMAELERDAADVLDGYDLTLNADGSVNLGPKAETQALPKGRRIAGMA